MKKNHIVFLDRLPIKPPDIQKLKNRFNVDIELSPTQWPSERNTLTLVKNATIVVSKWVYIGENIINSSPSLKYVVMAMTGYHDWVDVNFAKKRSIRVSNVPDFSSQAVAEHAVLLLLSVARKLLIANYNLKKGKFDPKFFQGNELSGKTIGIIGYGNIGRRIGKLARGFNMKILTADSKTNRSKLRQMLPHCQILTIHTPLTPKTEKLIGEKELSLLPKGTIVINTSRGKVIDETALIKYLKNDHLAGAGLDVFEKEPPDIDNPLFTMENVVATPHLAWNTKESMERLINGVIKNLEAFLNGKPINLVT